MEENKNSIVYRFEIFKGRRDEQGKIIKVKQVGAAYNRIGLKTYAVHLKPFLKDPFYLLPNTKRNEDEPEYVILTREPSKNVGRKFYWSNVGDGRILDGVNKGLLQLQLDVLGVDLFMNLHPANVTELSEATLAECAA